MTYRPKQNKKSAYTISAVLLAGGIVCIACAPFFNIMWLMQFLGLAFFTGCIFFIKRYTLQEYIYTLELDGEVYDLSVNEVYGKRSHLVCRLAISTCVAFEKKSENENKYGRVSRKYNYCVNFDAKDVYCFFFRESEDGELGMLLLECDSVFAGYLGGLINNGREVS